MPIQQLRSFVAFLSEGAAMAVPGVADESEPKASGIVLLVRGCVRER